jgi:DNA methylase
MLSDAQVRKALNRVDWDFARSYTSYGLHAIHWYPGTFVPQIPALLIEILSSPNDVVYDPFCGIGTTLVEALRLGRRAIGVDVNPIATRAALAKVRVISPGRLARLLKAFLAEVHEHLDEAGPHTDMPLLRKNTAALNDAGIPNAALLQPWFHPDTWFELVSLCKASQRQTGSFRRLCEVTVSSILKPASSQREHWGYVADNMVPRRHVYVNAVALFERKMQDALVGMRELLESPLLHPLSTREIAKRVQVVTADVRQKPAAECQSVDLVVTSPPYPNVTDYARSQRLSMLWSDLQLDEIREQEIGARYKRHRQAAIRDYVADMERAISFIAPSLKAGKYFCCVIGLLGGESGRGKVVQELKGIMETNGLVDLGLEIRRRPARQRLRRKDGSVTLEEIMVFKKLPD